MLEDLDQRIKSFLEIYENAEASVFKEKGQAWGCRVFNDNFFRKPQYFTVLGQATVRADFWEIKDTTASAPDAMVYYTPPEGRIVEERFTICDKKAKGEQILHLEVRTPNLQEYLFSKHAKVLKTLPDEVQDKLSPLYAFFNLKA